MATRRGLVFAVSALVILAAAPNAQAADPSWVTQARAASQLLNGDERECVEARVGRALVEKATNGRPSKAEARRFLSSVAQCSGGDALPCVRTTKKSPILVANRPLPNVVTYQSPGLSSLVRPLPAGTPSGVYNGFILADPTTGPLPDGTHLLAFTGAQTAQGTGPGQEERSPTRRWIIPALTGSETNVTATATDQVYELPNTWQSPTGLGVVGWWQILSGDGFAPVLLALGRSTSAPRSQDNAIHAWRAQNAELTQWTYTGQIIDAPTLRQSAGGSFSDGGFVDARISSLTFVPIGGSSFRVYAGLEANGGRSVGTASLVLDASGTGLPTSVVDAGMRAAKDEARVVPLIGPGGRTVGYAMGVGRPDQQSCLALSPDGLTFGDPVLGTAHSSMTLVASSPGSKSTKTTWLALGTKSGPNVTDGITATWLDLTTRRAPSRPTYSISD